MTHRLKLILPLLAGAALAGCYCPAHAATPPPPPPPVAQRTPDPDKPFAYHLDGWKSNPEHKKSLLQIVHAPGFKAAPQPRNATVRAFFYKTNQKDLGACTAFTGIESMDAVYKRDTGQWVFPSALDFYQQESIALGTWPEDKGAFTSTIIQIATKSAVCSERKYPYLTTNYAFAAPSCAVKARQYSALVGYDVPSDDGGDAVRNCIANLRTPVMIGGYWPANWMEPIKDAKTGLYYLPRAKGRAGGHEIPAISYDRDLVLGGIKDLVEIHNHWTKADGSVWGSDIGSVWVSAKDLFDPKRFEDFGALQTMKPLKK